ncbi:hypothetical protein KKI23_00405 [Patescibacteria group bacterium]|nr:hypothetical protein [Patescibacteria group bacterium]
MNVSWWFVWLTSLLGGLVIGCLCLTPRIWSWLEEIGNRVSWLGGLWRGVAQIGLIYTVVMLVVFDLNFGQKAVWLLCLTIATPAGAILNASCLDRYGPEQGTATEKQCYLGQ